MDTFEIITWPDIQAYMILEDFNENACLANAEWCINEYGSSAYFVRKEWLNSLNLDERAKIMKNLNDK
jgi:hypothetical protein